MTPPPYRLRTSTHYQVMRARDGGLYKFRVFDRRRPYQTPKDRAEGRSNATGPTRAYRTYPVVETPTFELPE